jgi:hypothetical protein
MGKLRRIIRTGLVIGVVAGALLAGSARADAAGAVGPYRTSQCGWYLQEGNVLDSKIAQAWLPSVAAVNTRAGVVDRQYVYVSMQWYYRSGSSLVGRPPIWAWTLASDNAYTGTWYTFGSNQVTTGVARNTGYDANSAGGAPDTYMLVSLSWYTGSTVTGSTSFWAQNSHSPNAPYVCNSGGTFF